jgi:hypothetical protein
MATSAAQLIEDGTMLLSLALGGKLATGKHSPRSSYGAYMRRTGRKS